MKHEACKTSYNHNRGHGVERWDRRSRAAGSDLKGRRIFACDALHGSCKVFDLLKPSLGVFPFPVFRFRLPQSGLARDFHLDAHRGVLRGCAIVKLTLVTILVLLLTLVNCTKKNKILSTGDTSSGRLRGEGAR